MSLRHGTGFSHLFTFPDFNKCKVERLEPCRKRHSASLIYKVAQDPNNRVLQRNRTRSDKKVKLKVEQPKREKYRKGPLYRGMELWDQIPHDIQKSDSVHILKAKIARIKLHAQFILLCHCILIDRVNSTET